MTDIKSKIVEINCGGSDEIELHINEYSSVTVDRYADIIEITVSDCEKAIESPSCDIKSKILSEAEEAGLNVMAVADAMEKCETLIHLVGAANGKMKLSEVNADLSGLNNCIKPIIFTDIKDKILTERRRKKGLPRLNNCIDSRECGKGKK